MRRYAAVFGLGVALPLLVALWLGGEVWVQAGLRYVAIQQGFAQASRHHSWEAAVDAEAEQVARVEDDEPARKPTKPARRR